MKLGNNSNNLDNNCIKLTIPLFYQSAFDFTLIFQELFKVFWLRWRFQWNKCWHNQFHLPMPCFSIKPIKSASVKSGGGLVSPSSIYCDEKQQKQFFIRSKLNSKLQTFARNYNGLFEGGKRGKKKVIQIVSKEQN